MSLLSLIAVDVGNARIKFGRFHGACHDALPAPEATLQLAAAADDLDRLAEWPSDVAAGSASWWIGSVNRPAASRLLDWLRERRPEDRVTLLAAADLPLVVEVEQPDMVGIDRLLNAVAANRLRQPRRPAVVVDLGTAITVDLLSADGTFCGGAILPGMGMSARALHEFTDMLPLVEMSDLAAPPPARGTCTMRALQSGLFWGAVGAIRELVAQMARQLDADPQVFVTGGAAAAVAPQLGGNAQHVPHLTLAGIAITAHTVGTGAGGR